MKLITASLVALTTLAGAASAMTPNTVFESQIKRFAPSADVSGLSAADVNKIQSILNAGGTDSEKRAAVRSALR